ncbi:hypothetical protein M885DRAFT_566544 [Pelagophyceae sp. CCMP2097]|nr:hypothetical protein M885DRAFT_566544 [Pelagophyceae sp. CCMP2097]
MFDLVQKSDVVELDRWIKSDPDVVHLRSADGRGPLWWAYEFQRHAVVQLLLRRGAARDAEDGRGVKPAVLKNGEPRPTWRDAAAWLYRIV